MKPNRFAGNKPPVQARGIPILRQRHTLQNIVRYAKQYCRFYFYKTYDTVSEFTRTFTIRYEFFQKGIIMDGQIFCIPWPIIFFTGILFLIVALKYFRNRLGNHIPHFERCKNSSYALEIWGPPQEVKKAHDSILREKIQRCYQVNVKEWDEGLWFRRIGFIVHRPKRLEAYVIQVEQFQEILLLISQVKKQGIKIDGRIRSMTGHELRRIAKSVRVRERELLELEGF